MTACQPFPPWPCADCGHVWAEGERRHEYDHHNGYAAEHQLDVEAVCTVCHHAREKARAGREIDGRTWDEMPGRGAA